MYEHPDRCMAIRPSAARQHGSHIGWEGQLPADRGSCVPEDVNTKESAASCSLGLRIYCRKTALCQQLRAWIMESPTPARAAEVAASIQKLWPAYWCCSRPDMLRMLQILDTNWLFVKALVRIDKEWSQAVFTKGDKTQNCSIWAEAGPGVTHNNV